MDQLQRAPIPTKPMMSLPQAVRQCLRKYAGFSGRATRAEFWWWALASYMAVVGFTIVDGVLSAVLVALGIPFISPLALLLAIGIFLPSLAVAVRRLHDIGKSGWWLLVWYAIQFIGSMLMLVSGLVLLFVLVSEVTGGSDSLKVLLGSSVEVLMLFFLLGVVGLVAMLAVSIWALVWLVRQGQRFPNRYGDDPRAWNADEVESA